MGKDANYIISDGNWHESMPYPGNDRVVKDYMAKNPDVKTIGIPVGCAYASVQILANSIERAGTLDREKIKTAIAATNMMTVRGPIRFRENGTAISNGFRQWQVPKSRIWPREVVVEPPGVPWTKIGCCYKG
jgi:branched-chain amino acid transport system substrate-binding protein